MDTSLFLLPLLLRVLFLIVGTKSDYCRRLDFKPAVIDKALLGHVINSTEVLNARSCRMLCYMEADCKSLNLGVGSKDGTMICEINDSDAVKHHRDLLASPGFYYCGTENKCSRRSCPAHRKCQNGFTDAGFHCVCSENGDNHGQAFGWIKINTHLVCFGARNDAYGNFTIKTAGQILSFKLVYFNGSVTCNRYASHFQSKWGCYGYTEPYQLDTHITAAKSNRNRLLPAKRFLSYGPVCDGYNYALPGFNADSSEIIFNNFSSSRSVCPGDQFQIWYGQDLSDCSESNNGGITCTDVYGLYE